MNTLWNRTLRHSPIFIKGLCLFLILSTQTYGQNAAYEIKASYIYNFLQFVTFPEKILQESQINVCVVGQNNFGNALDQIESSSTPQGKIHIIYLNDYSRSSLSSCNAIYVTESEKNNTQSILSNLNTKNVFTIAEYVPFISLGGLVELYIKDDKIHFRINKFLARHANFQISSQLLQLGTS
jgi:hypothetical protein